MFGLIQVEDQVCFQNDDHSISYAVVVDLTDDRVWADVRLLVSEEVVQLPVAILNALD